MDLPGYACREAVTTAAVKAAVNGIGACSPEGSNIAVTLSVCAGEQTIWLAFINQIKVAFCYIFGVLADILAAIDNIPPVHSGTPSVAPSGAAGSGATATLVSGSTDVQGAVEITIGATPTPEGGVLAVLTFGTQFANDIFPLVSIFNDTTQRGLIPGSALSTAPVSSIGLIAQYPLGSTGSLGEGDTLVFAYKIGFTA